MVSNYHRIRNAIEKALHSGKKDFIIYPYGENGALTKRILNDSFGITERYIIDNKLSCYNTNIKSLDYFQHTDHSDCSVLFTCANTVLYKDVISELYMYFPIDNVIKIFEVNMNEILDREAKNITHCGKYSYGPLCNHWLVKSVGSFCSFANGSDVVENHAVEYLSTSPFLYIGGADDRVHGRVWEEFKDEEFYFDGVEPKAKTHKLEKITIGNDVWLGKNVLITNGSNIGNGVIAGAGAVITKDVPDYAVVAGVPARIIRYRYTSDEIDVLNRIAWWDWSDDKIRRNYNDFFLDIKEFIGKHGDL